MYPMRRFSAFISRICLTIFLFSTSLFVIFGLTKYIFHTDNQRFVPAGNSFLNSHNHHDHDHHHGDRRV
jgi:predicted RND superfamily exporter protein